MAKTLKEFSHMKRSMEIRNMHDLFRDRRIVILISISVDRITFMAGDMFIIARDDKTNVIGLVKSNFTDCPFRKESEV